MTIVVEEQGAEEIRRIATAVSDPSSPEYGNFLSSEEILRKTAPKSEDMDAVTDWLDAAGVGYQTRHSNVVSTMPVSVASELFSTSFHVVGHLAHPRLLLRATTDYSLPTEVAGSIMTVFGLRGLPLPPRSGKELEIASHGPFPRMPANVTPAVIAETYGIKGVKVSPESKTRQAVAEFQGQFMNSTDLAVMFADYVSDYKVGTDDVVSKFFGEHKENSQGVEAELDIQYIMSPAVGIKTEFWEFPGNDFGSDLNQWTSNLTTAGGSVPIVHSVSYGWQGNLSQINVKDSDVEIVDSNLQKMAAMGMSVMISSGDSGSGYTPGPTDSCTSVFEVKPGTAVTGEEIPIGTERVVTEAECCDLATEHHAKAFTFAGHFLFPRLDKCTLFSSITGHKLANRQTISGTYRGDAPTPALWPSWPASSPWVTAVGATRFIGQEVGNAEMATDQFGSGGGFSKQFDQTNAAWQAAATAKYLETAPGLPPPGAYAAKGRGTPDVSALGEGYQVIVGGRPTSVGGTSASSPAFASMVSLLNEARMQAGKKPMGCLNPFICKLHASVVTATLCHSFPFLIGLST
eukprot:COSAG02_NODE_3329_length_6926_cov_4.245203_5_plen_574_part_00